jgi:hypothetical protein
MGKDVRAEGPVRQEIQLTAASTWDKTGGYFCNINTGTGTADMTDAADTVISGWMKIGFDPNNSAFNKSTNVLTVPATTTDEYKFGFIPAQQLEYARLPVSGTLAATHGGAQVDIILVGSKQFVDLAASTTDVLIVLPPSPEDIADQMARVIVNPAKIGR